MTQFRLIRTLKQLTACLFIGLTSPALSQTFELSLEQGRVAARQAALQGQFQLARDLALGLTEADENDRLALIVLAAVQPKLDAPREGRRAGARAYRLSQTDDERYEAARLTALAAANEERYTLSQLWLRRAAVNAPDEAARAQTRNDYRGIRNLNPWSMNFGFSVTPSGNVNGGSDTSIYSINGVELPFGTLIGSSLALSGTAVSGDLRLGYAVSRSPVQLTTLTARLNARSVWLSQEARETSPDSRNSDFAYQALEFGISHKRRLDSGTLSLGGATGATWFGGDINSTFNRAELSYQFPVSDTVGLTVSGQVQHNSIKGSNPRTTLRNTVSTGLSYVTESGNRISGQLTFDAQSAEVSSNDRFESWTAQISYAWAKPVGPVQLSITGGISDTHYRDYSLGFPIVGGRQELRRYTSINAVFPDIDYAGFVPTMAIGFQDTQSNISRFQRDEFSLNIGVRSSF